MDSVKHAICALSVAALCSGCGGSGTSAPDVPNRPSLTVSAGDFQTGSIGQVLPELIVVTLLASSGAPIANADLSFDPLSGPSENIQTGADGTASYDWRLGDAYDQQLVVTYTPTPTQTISTLANAIALYEYQAPASDAEWPAAHADSLAVATNPLTSMINAIRRGDFPKVHTVLLARDGQLVLEEQFPLVGETSYTKSDDVLHYVASASKSITSVLVGIAVDQGLIGSLNDSLYSYFPQYSSFDNWTPEKDDLTIRDALLMRSGLGCADDGSWEGTQDFVKTTLDLPLIRTPGTTWKYCTMLTHVLGSVVANVSGMNLADYSQTFLWDPLGIDTLGWTYSPVGRAVTGYGFWMRPRDMLKFGQLVLNRGSWNGAQVVSEAWAEESAYSAATDTGLGHDLYAYQWWVLRVNHGGTTHLVPYAAGDGGQMIFVLAEHGVTAVFTGGNYGTDLTAQPIDLLLDYVLPALN